MFAKPAHSSIFTKTIPLPLSYKTSDMTLAERKENFLRRLSSPSDKTKYKRYTGAPIRYAGGKSLAVGLVVERIPDNVKASFRHFWAAVL